MSPVPTRFVILDLDGLILDTETLCLQVAKKVVAKYGKELTLEAHKAAVGKRPVEAWAAVAAILGMDVDPNVLFDDSEPMLQELWPYAKLMPGAMRLVQHLHKHNIPFAIATSTPRATFNRKMSTKPHLSSLLRFVVCGDEVPRGKPSPDVFLEAARLMGAEPCECLVIEDAPSGVEGAVAAGMRVSVVPSLLDDTAYPVPDPECCQGVCEKLPSLLAFKPELHGLPSFDDLVHGVIPMNEVIHIKGKVVKGFGRGSRELGIPTANVDSESLASTLAEAVTGIYAGWASVGSSSQVYKMVMSIGWNPFYGNKEKTAEPWILHEFNKPFYDEEIRLVVCGYIRPEANFVSLQALIDRIHEDGRVSKEALDLPPFISWKEDTFLVPSPNLQQQTSNHLTNGLPVVAASTHT